MTPVPQNEESGNPTTEVMGYRRGCPPDNEESPEPTPAGYSPTLPKREGKESLPAEGQIASGFIPEECRLAALEEAKILDTPPDANYDEITQLAANLCGVPIAMLSLVAASRVWHKSVVGLETQELPRDVAFAAHTIAGDDLLVIPDVLADDRFSANPLVTGPPNVRFYAGAPIVTDDGLAVGSLCLYDTEPRQLTGVQAAALRVLARHASTLFNLARHAAVQNDLAAKLDETEMHLKDYKVVLDFQQSEPDLADRVALAMATSDSLTGLKNRRAFDERLTEECMRAERRQRHLSVLMLDVDDFQRYNDQFGPQEGDRVLRTIASAVEASARDSDVVARYSGNRFALILPETDHPHAFAVAERMRKCVEEILWEKVTVTISFGVCTVSRGLFIAEQIVEEVERALKMSKAAGRNRVTGYDVPAPPPAPSLLPDD